MFLVRAAGLGSRDHLVSEKLAATPSGEHCSGSGSGWFTICDGDVTDREGLLRIALCRFRYRFH